MLRTERLLLRPLRPGDLEHLQRYATRPEFYRYLPIPEQTRETVTTFLEQQLAEAARPDKKTWVFGVEPFDVGRIVGTVRITIVSQEEHTADMGYALDSDFYRRGYMTEAARAVLDFGFHELGLRRIWATADVENRASWRVLERIGMKRERSLQRDKLLRGAWRDSYLYTILKEEFDSTTTSAPNGPD
jgi:RimJ/RimL family protein N-acetyltransferase